MSATNPKRVRKALIEEREKCRKLTFDVERLQKEIKKKGVKLDSGLVDDIQTIMDSNTDKISPFMNLFWNEQKRLATTSQYKYHPILIRFCLSLAAESAKVYDELRDSKVLVLPSRRTLRDYKNVIKPTVGFNSAIVEELTEIAKPFKKGHQQNIVISIDKMKIQEDLVFNKHSGELIG